MIKIKILLIAFCQSKKSIFENLGIERLSAFLEQKGYDISYRYVFPEEDFLSIIKEYDIIGFSLYPDSYDIAKKCISICHKEKKLVIAGSKFATDYYEFVLQDIPELDYLVMGHGEHPFLYLLEEIAKGTGIDEIINNNSYIINACSNKTPSVCIQNIRELPWPNRQQYITCFNPQELMICDSHGCIARCSFCSNCQNMRKYSTRRVEDLVNEIFYYYDKFNIRQFFFVGNSFEDPGAAGKQKINELCDIIMQSGKNISLGCYIRGNFIKKKEDRELLDKMVKSGFSYIFVGVEAGNEDDLKLYNKNATVDDCICLMTHMQNYRNAIYTAMGFIMINPYSNLQRFRQNYHFLSEQRCCILDSYISKLHVYYATEIHDRVKNDGLLRPDYNFLNTTAYEFIDKDAAEIDKFISEHLYPIRLEVGSLQDILRYNYQIRRLLQKQNDPTTANVLDNLASILADFFRDVYINFDKEKCISKIEIFKKELKSQYDKLILYNIKLKKELMKLDTQSSKMICALS